MLINLIFKFYFKHHFQKNKDWNPPVRLNYLVEFVFKHHFQKNKDWNSAHSDTSPVSESL